MDADCTPRSVRAMARCAYIQMAIDSGLSIDAAAAAKRFPYLSK